MSSLDIATIASQIDEGKSNHPIADLQNIRKKLKNLSRRSGSLIFAPESTKEAYAFHYGGRSELQFNIGRETAGEDEELRHGVAFSFKLSRTLTSIDVLVPKVKFFNDFIRMHPESFDDMRLWWNFDAKDGNRHRSELCLPRPIPPELVTEGVFVFFGGLQPASRIDIDRILDDFDRLLALYEYVEGGGKNIENDIARKPRFTLNRGCAAKSISATATLAQRELDIALRHNEIQRTLYDALVLEFGSENVGTECPSGIGTKVDVVVKHDDGFWFFEIKTALTPRACLREALGQLLEYSFWPGGQRASKLFVVGESPLDSEGDRYLRCLREEFSLPLEYRQIQVI